MRHRWSWIGHHRGPRGGIVIERTCCRCGLQATSQSFSRKLVPECAGGDMFDPGAILWHARMAALNRRYIAPTNFDDAFSVQEAIQWE